MVPFPVASDGSLAAKDGIILAHMSDSHEVGHELGYDPLITTRQYADIQCVAVYPRKYVCHLSRAARGGDVSCPPPPT